MTLAVTKYTRSYNKLAEEMSSITYCIELLNIIQMDNFPKKALYILTLHFP
jgi:hypothetical protein